MYNVTGTIVAGVSNYVDASFSAVIGNYNTLDTADIKTVFGIGRGTGINSRSNIMQIRHNESSGSDTIYLNSTCSIGDVSAGLEATPLTINLLMEKYK